MITIFNVALAPYRIDFFNSIAKSKKASFYFSQGKAKTSPFDYKELKKNCNFNFSILPHFSAFGVKLPLSVWNILRKERPRTVLTPEFSLITLMVILYKLLFRASYKVISVCDDSIDMLSGNDFSRMHTYARKLMVPFCDELVLLDKSAVDWYQQYYHKGIWFPLIRDDEKYATLLTLAQPTEERIRQQHPEVNHTKVVLFVGRLIALKNIDSIIKALPDYALLIIVGDGEERENLQILANKLGKQVIFVGWKNGSELLAWYRIAHVLVLASYREPFGAVVNEALLTGCRVCVSERAGSACLVTDNNGTLFNPKDHDELKKKISQQLDLQSLKKDTHSLMIYRYTDFIERLRKIL